mgnify:CR=1 FL=1
MLNRAERRAIQFGRGRMLPMIEVNDMNTLAMYVFGLVDCGCALDRDAFQNRNRLFIDCQMDPFDWRDDWDE